MIRRGLQIVCVGIAVLGAAPSFGQAPGNGWPNTITLQDFGDPVNNGLYVLSGELTSSGAYLFQRYSADGYSPQRWVAILVASNHNFMGIWNQVPDPSANNVGRLAWSTTVSGTNIPPTYSFGTLLDGSSGGVAINSWAPAPPPDPYEEAFPDWESASTVIPLGFGFGMVFWAACLAFHVPMRWVRQLADAAS